MGSLSLLMIKDEQKKYNIVECKEDMCVGSLVYIFAKIFVARSVLYNGREKKSGSWRVNLAVVSYYTLEGHVRGTARVRFLQKISLSEDISLQLLPKSYYVNTSSLGQDLECKDIL